MIEINFLLIKIQSLEKSNKDIEDSLNSYLGTYLCVNKQSMCFVRGRVSCVVGSN